MGRARLVGGVLKMFEGHWFMSLNIQYQCITAVPEEKKYKNKYNTYKPIFACFLLSADLFNINFSKQIFHEYHQSVK